MVALNCLVLNLIQCLDDLRKSFHASPGQGQGSLNKIYLKLNKSIEITTYLFSGVHRHARRVQDFGSESFPEDVFASQHGLRGQEGHLPPL